MNPRETVFRNGDLSNSVTIWFDQASDKACIRQLASPSRPAIAVSRGRNLLKPDHWFVACGATVRSSAGNHQEQLQCDNGPRGFTHCDRFSDLTSSDGNCYGRPSGKPANSGRAQERLVDTATVPRGSSFDPPPREDPWHRWSTPLAAAWRVEARFVPLANPGDSTRHGPTWATGRGHLLRGLNCPHQSMANTFGNSPSSRPDALSVPRAGGRK